MPLPAYMPRCTKDYARHRKDDFPMNDTEKMLEVKNDIIRKLSRYFGCSPREAAPEQVYKAAALSVLQVLTEKRQAFKEKTNSIQAKKVYYLSMEFLVGRSLKTNLANLGLTQAYKEALSSIGFDLDTLYEFEPDAGLGNGGLGRLAACFMDSLSELAYPATGFSICYEYGLFQQKIVDGIQVELPDNWLPGGDVWLVPRTDRVFRVRFGGKIREIWENGRLEIVYDNCEEIEAVPYDMMISGADSEGVSQLRLWKARDLSHFNMGLFARGEYSRALEPSINAEIICKVLYPSDNHYEGKLLRLTQQYFLVSASCQNIIRDHIAVYGSLDHFSEKVAIHINDTHPALCIPELMRIFMDDHSYSWEAAWDMVQHTVTYTNHTVLPEALETWNEDLFRLRLPRIHQILRELNERFSQEMWNHFPGEWNRISEMAILSDGTVRMANLAVVASAKVNGVSKIHSDIIKNTIFKDFYKVWPDKFDNVTNGIAHHRWLCYANPALDKLIAECIGEDFRKKPDQLTRLRDFEGDGEVLRRLGEIKAENKRRFSKKVFDKTGVLINPESIFDVQIKRLHEYKRQLLNAMNIIGIYLDLRDNRDADILPQTFIFGAKAAPGYRMAKEIIRLIWCLGEEISWDARISEKLQVVFVENYNVSIAEALIPAAEVSQQISLAGKEASGTGCMKLMINGAITVGTADGANIEMLEQAGHDNMFMFGLGADEVHTLWTNGYHSTDFFAGSERLQRIISCLNTGFNGESFSHIAEYLLASDPYMCMADFESYHKVMQEARMAYRDRENWNRMSLMNIAGAGQFASVRSVEEYANRIWHLQKIER